MNTSHCALVLVLAVALSGCMVPGGTDQTTATTPEDTPTATTMTSEMERGGQLYVEIVESAPDGATVVEFENTSLDTSQLLVSTLDAALDGDRIQTTNLDSTERETLADRFEDVPRFSDSGRSGYYIRYRSTLFFVQVRTNL